jgi:DNA-damage-inducible protein J
MTQSSMLHVRLDDETKEKATEALNAMGISVSDAVRLFLRRVVADQAIPFEIKVPNAETRSAMAEADDLIRNHRDRFKTAKALFEDLEKNADR